MQDNLQNRSNEGKNKSLMFNTAFYLKLLIFSSIRKLYTIQLGQKFSCFPHFLKTSSESVDFIEFIFENGCCRRIFGNVSAKIKE